MRAALVILLLAVPASAVPASADNVPHKEGAYGGVSPGETPSGDAAARPAKPKRPPPRGTLTWVGFEAKDGGAEVFFQSTAPFEVSQHIEGAQLVVHLSLTRLGQNTWRQVDTRFFDNPLSGVVARAVGAARAGNGKPARGRGIDARIAFKNPKDVREGRVRTASEADGMFYAYVKFPQGTAVEPAATMTSPAEPAAEDSDPDAAEDTGKN